MDHGEMIVFSGNANRPLAEAVAAALHLQLGDADVKRFSDGEVHVEINESVRGADCFIIQPTCPPADAHLMELLVMIDALRRGSAGRIVAVLPYYGYARQDRKVRGREPITAKLVANLITAAGADRVLAMDLHADQIQGFFDLPVDHLPARRIIADYLISEGYCGESAVIVSPDVGGVNESELDAFGAGMRDEAVPDFVQEGYIDEMEQEPEELTPVAEEAVENRFGGINESQTDQFLDRIREAFDRKPRLANLLLDPYFKKAVRQAQPAWRKVLTTAIQLGIPCPAMSAALSYYDGYRCERLPANLLQAQRDYFGAHTYERVDHPRGVFFHTNWTGEGGATASTAYTV